MSVELKQDSATRTIDVTVSGKLDKEDYAHFVPMLEDLIRQWGKVRILFIMRDFHGWTAGALWQDIKFDLKHFKDIERLAMVGEARWEKGMATFCKPFTTAEIRFFPLEELDAARQWVSGEAGAAEPESPGPEPPEPKG